VVNRTVVLLALNAMACGAIQASVPASKAFDFGQSDALRNSTDERLHHPEAGDWLMYGGRTMAQLQPFEPNHGEEHREPIPAWSLNTDLVEAHETTRS